MRRARHPDQEGVNGQMDRACGHAQVPKLSLKVNSILDLSQTAKMLTSA